MCCLVDAEGNGERGGFYLCGPLPETPIQDRVLVPRSDSIQKSSQSGKISQRAHGRGCRHYFFQTAHNEARRKEVDESRVG